jgi:hypothetical protein
MTTRNIDSRRAATIAALLLLTPGRPAMAEDAREFCADRPGLGTPTCTLAPGAAVIETGVAGWERSRSAESVDDEITLGDALLRVGLGESTEVQLGLTSHVIQRSRDRASGEVERVSGVGDATLAVRQGLAGPNGPVAIQAFVTLPVAKRPIGSGAWSAGFLLPASVTLSQGFDLELTPEIDLTPNADRPGRHVAWGGVVGLSRPLTERLSLTGELAAFRDEDPDERSTDARVAASLAWQVAERLQVDFEADLGLSNGAPDHALALGFAWQFR